METNQNDMLASFEKMELAVHFITGYRGAGHQLPYTELAIVKRWLGAAKDLDHLLVVLADVLPEHFQRTTGERTTGERSTGERSTGEIAVPESPTPQVRQSSRPKSLHHIRNKVIDKLRSTR